MQFITSIFIMFLVGAANTAFASKVESCPNIYMGLRFIAAYLPTKENPYYPKDTVTCYYTEIREPLPEGKIVLRGKFSPHPGNWYMQIRDLYECTPYMGEAYKCKFTRLDD